MKQLLKYAVTVLLCAAALVGGVAAQDTDPWQPLRRLTGEWTGTASGQAGDGTVASSYAFLSDDEFIETFELAPPGKPFQVYGRNHFRRAAK